MKFSNLSQAFTVVLVTILTSTIVFAQTKPATSSLNNELVAGSKYDEYTKATGIATRNFRLPDEDVGATFFYLRSAYAVLLGRVTDAGQEGISLRIVYENSNGWVFLSNAHDIEGTALPVKVVSRDVISSDKVREEIEISLTRNYLIKFKSSGINIRIDGKIGQIFVKYPSSEISGFLEVLENIEGQVRNKLLAVPTSDGTKPRLGVRFVPITDKAAQAMDMPEPKGVLVIFIGAGTPAEASGIKVGDVILSYNGVDVPATTAAHIELVSAGDIKSVAKIKLRRGKDDAEVSVSFQTSQ